MGDPGRLYPVGRAHNGQGGEIDARRREVGREKDALGSGNPRHEALLFLGFPDESGNQAQGRRAGFGGMVQGDEPARRRGEGPAFWRRGRASNPCGC